MASMNKDKKSGRILFVGQNGDRRQICPGNVHKHTAEQIGRHCDALGVTKVSSGIIPKQTAL